MGTPVKKTELRALGFCGADDSVDPLHVGLIAKAYPTVEFGVLFRPDKEGQPRYATMAWVEQFSEVLKKLGISKAAAHLCGQRVNDLLDGKTEFISQLEAWGFTRVQINCTAVNGVDVSGLANQVETVRSVMEAFPKLEFIVQKNSETEPLWGGLLKSESGWPTNAALLVDESRGTGIEAKSWPPATGEYPIGYAGGIGPHNIDSVLVAVQEAGKGERIWIDMESSLRSIKNGNDIFDLDKCFRVIRAACAIDLVNPPMEFR